MCINSTFLLTIITVSVLALCLAHSVVYTECSCSFYFVELQLNNFVQNIFANGSFFFSIYKAKFSFEYISNSTEFPVASWLKN